MPEKECFILIGVGGFFVLLGLVGLLWGRREEKGYYDSLHTRTDVREFLEHTPERPEPGSLRIGGWITIALGVVMLALGGVFLLQG